jgi:hypothetical protein
VSGSCSQKKKKRKKTHTNLYTFSPSTAAALEIPPEWPIYKFSRNAPEHQLCGAAGKHTHTHGASNIVLFVSLREKNKQNKPVIELIFVSLQPCLSHY